MTRGQEGVRLSDEIVVVDEESSHPQWIRGMGRGLGMRSNSPPVTPSPNRGRGRGGGRNRLSPGNDQNRQPGSPLSYPGGTVDKKASPGHVINSPPSLLPPIEPKNKSKKDKSDFLVRAKMAKERASKIDQINEDEEAASQSAHNSVPPCGVTMAQPTSHHTHTRPCVHKDSGPDADTISVVEGRGQREKEREGEERVEAESGGGVKKWVTSMRAENEGIVEAEVHAEAHAYPQDSAWGVEAGRPSEKWAEEVYDSVPTINSAVSPNKVSDGEESITEWLSDEEKKLQDDNYMFFDDDDDILTCDSGKQGPMSECERGENETKLTEEKERGEKYSKKTKDGSQKGGVMTRKMCQMTMATWVNSPSNSPKGSPCKKTRAGITSSVSDKAKSHVQGETWS